MGPRKFKAVLFDKDGTLFDVDGTWVPVYRHMLQAEKGIGISEAHALMALAGYDPATGKITGGSIMAGGTTRQLVDVWWPHEATAARADIATMIDQKYAGLSVTYLAPLMPLEPIFHALKAKGYILGVATNDSYPSTLRQLESKNLTGYLEKILTADTVKRAKPSGDMIRAFAAATGLSTTDIVMVGDNTHDIEEARAGEAGLAVGVLTGNGSREELEHEADLVLDSIADLIAALS
jgi:phosphoglycolate phosphatase